MAKLKYLIVKKYILTILSSYNFLYKIYYTLKKEFRYIIIVKKEKNIIGDNDKICVYSNISTLDEQDNQ